MCTKNEKRKAKGRGKKINTINAGVIEKNYITNNTVNDRVRAVNTGFNTNGSCKIGVSTDRKWLWRPNCLVRSHSCGNWACISRVRVRNLSTAYRYRFQRCLANPTASASFLLDWKQFAAHIFSERNVWQPQRNVGISPVVVYSDNITDKNTIRGCKYGCCDVLN